MEDFSFQTSFLVKDGKNTKVFLELLELELGNLFKNSERMHSLNINVEGNDKITIMFKAKDSTAYKIVLSSLNRYLEIINKSLELVEE